MAKGDTHEYTTLTVTASKTVGRDDGAAALVLYSQEAGPIAFAIDLEAIDTLRRELAVAEQFLREHNAKS